MCRARLAPLSKGGNAVQLDGAFDWSQVPRPARFNQISSDDTLSEAQSRPIGARVRCRFVRPVRMSDQRAGMARKIAELRKHFGLVTRRLQGFYKVEVETHLLLERCGVAAPGLPRSRLGAVIRPASGAKLIWAGRQRTPRAAVQKDTPVLGQVRLSRIPGKRPG